ncbi:MAG: hypothetical protein M3Z54_10050 [Gemmatimonadota bacterium]|nr:hypothetical protein [Gemmatimonadota bacterium]
MRISVRTFVVGTVIVAGCGSSDSKSSSANDHAGSIPPSATRSARDAQNGNPASCPRTGQWALCSVERRLQQAGFVLREAPGQPQRRAGFSILPAAYTLNRSRLEVFVYPDAAGLERDLGKIDTLTASPVGTASQWQTPIAWVRSGNLAAVFITDNATQSDRLTLALGAGAPQP